MSKPGPHRRPTAQERRDQQVDQYVHKVGEALHQVRIIRGLTLAQLAQRARVSVRQLIQIEAGKNTSLRTIAQLCQAMDVAPWGLPWGSPVPGELLGQTLAAAAQRLGLSLRAPPSPRRRRR